VDAGCLLDAKVALVNYRESEMISCHTVVCTPDTESGVQNNLDPQQLAVDEGVERKQVLLLTFSLV
jgi:hypothetical protein